MVNLSLYGEGRNGALESSIRRASAAGVVVVAAAGNEGTTTPQYPAAYPDVLGVAATDENGGLAVYSSRGDWVEVAAPGCTPTTQLGGGFGQLGGGLGQLGGGFGQLGGQLGGMAGMTRISGAALGNTLRPLPPAYPEIQSRLVVLIGNATNSRAQRDIFIDLEDGALAACLADAGQGVQGAFGRGPMMDGHPSPGPGRLDGDLGTDAPAAAGHEHDPVGQLLPHQSAMAISRRTTWARRAPSPTATR